MTVKQNIREHILNVAADLIQTRGYNAFSYRDLVDVVGVKTSSIHYHFPTKEDLGRAVLKQQSHIIETALHTIRNDSRRTCKSKLALFFDTVFKITYFSNRKMCLGGMLASDVHTLPTNMQLDIQAFFSMIQDWLAELLLEGTNNKEFVLIHSNKKEAAYILSILEGTLLLARLYQDEKRLTLAKDTIIKRLTSF